MMQIFDTLNNKKTELKFSDKVRIYLCGVTVYDDATTNFSAQDGDTFLVTGNMKLADGTAYVPATGAENGRIQFEFNDSAKKDA